MALEAILGPADATRSLAPRVPFQFGGDAAVLCFSQHLAGGAVFVTADLTGFPGVVDQAKAWLNGYELAMCQPQDEIDNPLSAAWLLSRFARFTLDESYAPGHTTDVRSADGPPIDGLVFTTLNGEGRSFSLAGRIYGVLLAVGIKADELEFAQREGADELLSRLAARGVLPWTRVNRDSVL